MQATRGAALTPDQIRASGDDQTPTVAADSPASRRPRAVRLCLAIICCVLVADTVSKHLAVAHLEGRDSVRLLWGAVYLLVTRNSGAAFSIGSGYTYVFPVIAIVVVGWLGWMLRGVRSLPWAVALGLVLGGAIGNLADRIFRAPAPFLGHVVDFISVFDAEGHGFPVFNLADSALCVGVGFAVLLELTGRRRDGTRV